MFSDQVYKNNFHPKCIYVAVMMRRMMDAILSKDAMDDKVKLLLSNRDVYIGSRGKEHMNLLGNPSTRRKTMVLNILLFSNNMYRGGKFIGNTSLIRRIKN